MAISDKSELAEFVHARHEELLNVRTPWEPFWDELGQYVMPRAKKIFTRSNIPETLDEIYDSTGAYCNIVLANGRLSWMTPPETRWFAFDPPYYLKGDDQVEQWYKICTEQVQLQLAIGNFYSQVHEMYFDLGGFGTGVLWCEPGKTMPLLCRKFDMGTYCIAEDDEGFVDTLSREFELTARQAVQWFGLDAVSDNVKKAYTGGDGGDQKSRKLEQKFWFRHLVYPRAEDERDPAKFDPRNKPIASIYTEKAEKHIVRIGGYTEQPFFACRYLKWFEGDPYGWSPSAVALPDMRQLNFLVKQSDALAEVSAFPRILIPEFYKGEIDLRANGITYYDSSNANARPSEWLTQGKYDIALERAEEKRKNIRNAFHTDLFKMFEGLDKEMTAREVLERSSEKLNIFSPTFIHAVNEFYNPFLMRAFRICLKAGLFPPPPEGVIGQDQNGISIEEPEITYSSRIALAIKSLENASFAHVIETQAPLMQVRPDILDNYNLDQISRDTSRNAGLPARWLNPLELVNQIRKGRAQQMAEAQKQQQLAQVADAAAKVGSVKNDSVAGTAMAGMLPGA